ncbi:NAD-dependent epimerase/dehydratase family protein [Falsihalocynthiibacter sp. BN13B15]|uniref:NAD-dependent epimerase/dehydratase family protein n=1 Tax=Falsihalocynthiibacter sp. BN13B15 TaxID=3240871 RepID=UPI00350F0E76
MTKGNALVTGAGGFVCSEVALALARAGYQTIATDQFFDAQTAQRLSHLQQFEAPLGAALTTLQSTKFEVVVHGAAQTSGPESTGQTSAAHIKLNTDLLTATLDYAREVGAKRFLFLSSMGVFAPDDMPQPCGRMTEATLPSGTFPYAAAKRAGEILTHGARDGAMETLSLRLGNTFGPHEASRPSRQVVCLVSRMIAAAKSTGLINAPALGYAREWSWLPDLADGIARLMGQFPASDVSVLHAGTPPVLTAADLAQVIARRIPGTTAALHLASSESVLRPPMASEQTSVMNDIVWTPVEVALDQMLRLKVST